MNNIKILSEKLASYLYKLEDARHVKSIPSFSFIQQGTSYSILLFKRASGEIVIDGRGYSLHPQKVFILSPGASVKLLIHSDYPIDYCHIQFYALVSEDKCHFVPAEMNCPDELFITHFHFLTDMVHEMERKLHSGNSWDIMKANYFKK